MPSESNDQHPRQLKSYCFTLYGFGGYRMRNIFEIKKKNLHKNWTKSPKTCSESREVNKPTIHFFPSIVARTPKKAMCALHLLFSRLWAATYSCGATELYGFESAPAVEWRCVVVQMAKFRIVYTVDRTPAKSKYTWNNNKIWIQSSSETIIIITKCW